MFVHWNCNIRDIMRSHISRWIVETVKEAYTQADRVYDRVTAHEIRALSASWAYNCQVALSDILSVAFWRSSGVFQNLYLRDMACIRLFHAPTRTTSSGCFMLHRTVHALWNLYGNPYRNRAETDEETIP